MTVVSQFLRDALKDAQVIGAGQSGGFAEETQDALRMLNEIIGLWRAKNVPVNPVSDTSQELNYPDGYEYALRSTLVEHLCSRFGTPMPEGLPMRAADARRVVFNGLVQLGPLALPSVLVVPGRFNILTGGFE